jgi:hypothetical protein
MKNVHILPTDKPSRISFVKDKLVLFNTEGEGSMTHHIYITSDEDINENDYIITKDGRLVQVSYLLSKDLEGASKVVLTIDQDLIKDGIQAIDDEFLEWFVNNPSCEEVEILIKTKTFDKDGFISSVICDTKNVEKIYSIIPQEEPKQEMPIINGSYGCIIETNKQETLEEAVNAFKKTNVYTNEIKQKQERSYSEEEMLEFSEWVSHNDWVYLPSKGYWVNEEQEELEENFTTKELFEQFKKR